MTRGGNPLSTLQRMCAGTCRFRLARVLCWCLWVAGLLPPALAAEGAENVALLARDLEASRYPMRVHAARLLGYLGDAGHLQALAHHARTDRAREARVAAAVAFGQIAAESDGLVLASLLREALLQAPGATLVDRQAWLLALLRAAAVAFPVSWTADVAQALSDPDPVVRQAACQALAMLGGPRAVTALRGVLQEADGGTRLAALAALAWTENPSALSALAEALGSSDSPQEAAIAAWALSAHPGSVGGDALCSGLHHALPAVRALCALMLARRGDATHLDALHRAADPVTEPSGQVRGAAVCALAALRAGDAREATLRALASGDPAERVGAACAARWLPDMPASALAEAAGDADPRVAAEAVCALAQCPDPAARQALLHITGLSGPGQREALRALSSCGGKESVPTLLRALAVPLNPNDPVSLWRPVQAGLAHLGAAAVPGLAELATREATVAERAVETLGLMDSPEATRALIGLRNAPDRRVRRACLKALGGLADRAAHDALICALSDADPEIAFVAARGLAQRPGGLSELLRLAQAAAGQAQRDATNRALDALVRSGNLPWACGRPEDRQILRAWLTDGGGAGARLEPWAVCARLLVGDDAAGDNAAALLHGTTDRQIRDDLCALLAANHLTVSAPALRNWLSETLNRSTGAAGTGRSRDLIAAADALGRLGDAESWELLTAALGEEGTIVAAALQALYRISPGRALPLLRRGLGDADPEVRATAFALLCGAGPEGTAIATRVAPQLPPSQWGPLAAACPAPPPAWLAHSPDPDLRLATATSSCLQGLLTPENLGRELLWSSCGLLPKASLEMQARAWEALRTSDPQAARRAACLRAMLSSSP